MEITKNMWGTFVREGASDNERRSSDANSIGFNKKIKDWIEAILQKQPSVLNNAIESKVEVATIHIGYRNGKIIKLLKERGVELTQGKLEKVVKIQTVIDDTIAREKISLQEPCQAFITFTNQEGFERAMKYLSSDNGNKENRVSRKDPLLGCVPNVESAPEPSDIIWENLEVSEETRKSKTLLVMGTISIILLLVFLLFTALKAKSVQNKLTYKVDKRTCIDMENDIKDRALMFDYAKEDQKHLESYQAIGVYTCFCRSITSSSPSEHKDLCTTYKQDILSALFLTNMLTGLISTINYVMKVVNVRLINKIGLETQGRTSTLIMQFTFVATFINSAVALLFMNADFEYSVLAPIPIRNLYPDLT